MSDQVTEAEVAVEGAEVAKKKGSKLPMIVALVLFLAGGGFFMMKGKGSAPKKIEAPALGTIEPMKEQLVNLDGGLNYLKCEIALHMVKDFKKEEFEKNKEAVTDAILITLRSKKLTDIRSTDQLRDLKREIATAVNKVLEEKMEGKKEAEGAASKDLKKGEKEDPNKPKIPEDYDSDKGPVLKVYFTSFATQ